jgi:hypothetical protein
MARCEHGADLLAVAVTTGVTDSCQPLSAVSCSAISAMPRGQAVDAGDSSGGTLSLARAMRLREKREFRKHISDWELARYFEII